MDVTVIGCGYVGLVTGTCLASIGHTVRGVEKDPKKLKTLQDGHCPIFEPGLQELMQENYASGQIQFTDNVKAAVKDAEVVFLCVGTPPKPDGTVDMSYLEGAGKEVCDALAEQQQRLHGDDHREVDRPRRHQPQALQLPQASRPRRTCRSSPTPSSSRKARPSRTASNPDRIVIGGESPEAFRMMRRLYDPLIKREENFLTMNWESAELTKYAANTHARGPHLVHERDDDPLRALRRRHRGHPQGHRLRQPHRPGVPPGRLRLRRLVLPEGRRRDGAHLQGRPATRACSSTRSRRSTRTRRSGSSTRSMQKLGRPIAGRDDRGVGPGVQGRHRRHPRVGRDRRDPLPARQGRARAGPRLQGHGEHEAGLQGPGRVVPRPGDRRRRRRRGRAADRLAAVHARCRSARSPRR